MPPLVLIGLAAAAAGLVLFGGGSGSTRTYTRRDIPKLRQLLLSKVYLGRELKNCLTKQTEHSLFNAQQMTTFGVGLFTVVFTGDPGAAMKAARATDAAISKLGGTKPPACQKEFDLTQQQLRQHDQVCAELGLPPEVTYEQVQKIVAQLGGLLELPGDPDDPHNMNSTSNDWDRCVNTSSVASCTSAWKGEGNRIPPYDPKTGLAIRVR